MKYLLLWVLFLPCVVDAKAATALRDPQKALIDELRITVSDLLQKVHSQDVERSILEEKIDHLEKSIYSLTQKLSAAQQSQGKSSILEKRMAALEKSLEGTTSDLQQLKAHANESNSSMGQYQNQLSDLKGNVKHLKTAMESLVRAIKKEEGISLGQGTYIVKPKDSLERIAKAHKTTIETIKKLNHLKNDRIIVGQELQLEEQNR